MGRATLVLLAVVLASSGCVKRTYDWGRFEDRLYRAYRSPEEWPGFRKELVTIIQRSDRRSRKVPPGICAELGYFYYKEGNDAGAIRYFEREMREWPESAGLMTVLIQHVQQRPEPKEAPDVGAGPSAAHDAVATSSPDVVAEPEGPEDASPDVEPKEAGP